MEEFWKLWGPAVPVAAAFVGFAGVVVRWLLKHIEVLTDNNKETVEKHIHDSTEATKENALATKELIVYLRNGKK